MSCLTISYEYSLTIEIYSLYTYKYFLLYCHMSFLVYYAQILVNILYRCILLLLLYYIYIDESCNIPTQNYYSYVCYTITFYKKECTLLLSCHSGTQCIEAEGN